MYWIKFILIAALLLLVLVVGIEFSTLNAEPVTINYLLGAVSVPLSVAVIGAFSAGVLLTVLIGAFVVLPLRWQVARLRQAVSSKDQEIQTLARKVGREVR
ncbi:MAG TPA: LapA family protein [Candidatus Competibacter sp.]|nr:LapA family protein [Candidatus Competibacter sp.]HUM93362.1 LapA family protein [Candidatus Competibacter sp.]